MVGQPRSSSQYTNTPNPSQECKNPSDEHTLSSFSVDSSEQWVLEPDDQAWPVSVPKEAHICHKIYGVGDRSVLLEPCISIVGARRGSPYGIAVAELAGRVAAECGLVVVSGGAIGCDSAAARAAYRAGGKTIVVSGCGANKVYPRSSADVFEHAQKWGCVVSLCPWGSPPQSWEFPKRNRLIAALSKVLIVCEAAMPSGTFSTAQAADDLGRRIYAAPGSIFSPYAQGTNWLLEQGAAIIVDEKSLEISIACDYDQDPLVRERLPQEQGKVLSAIVAEPMRPDDLAKALKIDVVTLLRTLGDYEAQGLVLRLPDGCYAPTKQALLGEAPHEQTELERR